MFCSQYGEIAFFGGLTASPAPLQPGTTRCDVTLVRESQRLDGVELVFGKRLAIFGVLPCFAHAKHYTPNPSIFSKKQFHYLPSKGT